MTQDTCTCQVCGFTADNLVKHINTAHAEKGGLVWYFDEYDVRQSEVVHPKLFKLTKDTPPKAVPEKTVKAKYGTLNVYGVEVPIEKETNPYVPAVNESFHFPTQMKDIAQDVLENKRIMLVGHTGTGKTSCIEQLAALTKNGRIRVNLNGQMPISDFVGTWTVKGGDMIWLDGALPKAMREGLWLILDEIDFADPSIISALNSVLEPNGSLTLKEKGDEIITPHKNFRIFSTGNSIGCMQDYRGLYQGTNIMNEAFLDRWRVYEVKYLEPEAEAKVLTSYLPKFKISVAFKIIKVANEIRKAFEEEEIGCTFSTRRLLDWSEMMIRHREPLKAAESTIFAKISKQDAAVVRAVIVANMSPNTAAIKREG